MTLYISDFCVRLKMEFTSFTIYSSFSPFFFPCISPFFPLSIFPLFLSLCFFLRPSLQDSAELIQKRAGVQPHQRTGVFPLIILLSPILSSGFCRAALVTAPCSATRENWSIPDRCFTSKSKSCTPSDSRNK